MGLVLLSFEAAISVCTLLVKTRDVIVIVAS